jgi:thioredoxin reductase (NADPH)
MTKPFILTVDDEAQVLNAIERDLVAHFSGDYRIVKAASGAEALDIVKQLKRRNDLLALFLVDQRMPSMTGTEFLHEARRYFPRARTVLLTAYSDVQAAIASINDIGLDYYLMKPWDPPDQNLYPILDEQLADWQATVDVPFDGIRVLGTQWSASSHSTKDFLARNRVPYLWLDIETSQEGRTLLDSLAAPEPELPVILFPDGSHLVNPSNLELAQKVGIPTEAGDEFYDLIIVGGGPAGLGAAVYGASEGLRTLLIEREATGGQAGTSSLIENYLGFPKGISGSDLARRATDQALRLGAEILTAREVVRVRVQDNYKILTLDDGSELSCQALIIATGVSLREHPAAGVERFLGAGVYYGAALTEAANYQGKRVFVVGAANSAGQGAMWLARFAKKVGILVRSNWLSSSMSQYLIDQIEAQDNIEILPRHQLREVKGSKSVESLLVEDSATGEEKALEADAVFVFIGAVAHTEMVADVVMRNTQGFIPTGPELLADGKPPRGWTLTRQPYLLETSVPGIFAAGDIRQSAVRRVASAVGQGAIAISQVHQYLKTV